jgi:hypothetical protein
MIDCLERRWLLSSGLSAANDVTHSTGVPQQIVEPFASNPARITLADRQQLIAHLTPGPLTASLSKTLRHSGPDAFDVSLLKYMVRRAGPYFFFNPKQLPDYVDYLNQKLASIVPQTLTNADAILAHLFPDQLNSETYTVQLPAAIDWDAQPASTDNADFLHGLNRHTFWKDLAVAYQYTGDGKYVRELAAQLQSWSSQTPPLADPNDWASSSPHWWLLDAADRATNWTYAYFMVLGSPDWTPAANTLFLKEIWEHGDFLSRVTPSGYAKNRTALHAAGLQRLGMLFPEFADAPAWEYKGTDMTFRSLAAQFFPDGGHVEETPAYAASAINAFLETYRLSELNNRAYWTKNRRHLLLNAVEAFYQLLSVDAGYSGLSDTYRDSNPRGFITRAALTLGDERYVMGRVSVEDVFLLGHDQLDFPASSSGSAVFDRGPSYALPDSGYYMLRGLYKTGSSGSFSDIQAVFDAGPKGGTHGHYDLLSFELQNSAMGPIIPDPGPYAYDDSPDRQWVISTPAHNTISIDGLNHQAIEGAGNPAIVVDDFETTADHTQITAHHHAYENLSGQPTVGRTLWLDRTLEGLAVAVVVDWGRSGGGHAHTFATSLNLGTRPVSAAGANAFDVAVTNTYRMRVQTISPGPLTTAVADTFISNAPPPDAKTPAKQYTASQIGTSALFVTVISQYTPGGFTPTQPATIAFDGPPRKGLPVHLRLTMPDGTVRLLDFPPPDLDPLPAASPAPLPFSTLPISTQTNTKFSLEPDDDPVYNHTAEVL